MHSAHPVTNYALPDTAHRCCVYKVMRMCVGALRLWLLSEVLWMSEGRRNCSVQQSSCYEFNHTSVTHSDADNICRSRGGFLVEIWDNKTQRRAEYLVGAEGYHYWIGGRLYITDQWTWVDGRNYSGMEALFLYVVFHPLLHVPLKFFFRD